MTALPHADAERTNAPPAGAQLERIARYTPLAILIYFGAQFAVRIAISGNLETDEAQFVGATHFALGYGNAHPPLYSWLVAVALEVAGHWVASVALVKNALLAGTYLFVYDTARRASGSAVMGLAAAACLALMPQIVWQSQFTLAHSVLVMFGAAALMHAMTLVALRPSTLHFAWLGLAASAGAMAKYNFFLLVAAAIFAVLLSPALRQAFASWRLVISGALFAAVCGPHLAWAFANIEDSTNRISKLERSSNWFGALDVPGIGIDGFLGGLLALASSAGALVLIWYGLRRLNGGGVADGPKTLGYVDHCRARADLANFYGQSCVMALAAFGAVLLVGDFHFVFERYLTPLLMPLPLWLALARPLSQHATRNLAMLAVAIWCSVLAALPLVVATGKDRLAFPYGTMAQRIQQEIAGPFAVLARRERDAANLVIRLPGSSIWQPDMPASRVLVIWSGAEARPPVELTSGLSGYAPAGDALHLEMPYENLSGAVGQLKAQLHERR
jgi:4-amino-4-deoxy-L-arabinose transferase-like glycosyltransferase